jgi:Activator of Hsp90 ATPase homolog 1-like protein
MTNTATETRSIIVEREIAYPPEQIWRALTQPHLIEEWLMTSSLSWATVSIFAQTGALSTVSSWKSSRSRRCLTRGVTMISRVLSHGLSPVRVPAHGADGFPAGSAAVLPWRQGRVGRFFAALEQVLARVDRGLPAQS